MEVEILDFYVCDYWFLGNEYRGLLEIYILISINVIMFFLLFW